MFYLNLGKLISSLVEFTEGKLLNSERNS